MHGNLTAGRKKNPVSLPDTIHNTCVWGAKKYHPQIHTKSLSGVCGPFIIHGPLTVYVHSVMQCNIGPNFLQVIPTSQKTFFDFFFFA